MKCRFFVTKARFWVFIVLFNMVGNVQAQLFAEIGETIGIDQVVEHKLRLGGGAAFFDYDNDLDDDLYLTGGGGRDQLFRNNGDGTFTDVSFFAGLGLTGQFFTTGVVTADVNNDGFKDIFVTTIDDLFGAIAPNLLLINDGNGRFDERGQIMGIDGQSWSFGATFFDYDLDGDLDLYVVNYVEEVRFLQDTTETGQISNVGYDHDCYDNFFYRNNGDGTFSEVSAEMGLTDIGCGLAVTVTDYDQDGDGDLMVINDFGEFVMPNALFENQYPQDTFINVASTTRTDLGIYGMGIATADYDLDGDWDYYVTNIGSNSLLEQQDEATFVDVATNARVDNTWVSQPNTRTTSWGATFADFDNDTYPDLFVANGQIEALSFIETGTHDPNKFFLNNGDKTFADLTESAGVGSQTRARGMAHADYDQDGDLDMIVTVLDLAQDEFQEPRTLFYQNNIPTTHHWLQIRLEGVDCHRDAYGTLVRVFVGDKILLRELTCGTSHLSQHSNALHFGLGTATQADSIEIRWLGGDSEWAYNVAGDQHLYYKQGEVGTSSVESATVYFQVDMRDVDVSVNGVYLVGDFTEDGTPLLLDNLGADIYATTQILQPGVYNYRFVNGSPAVQDNYEQLAATDSCTNVREAIVYRTLEVTGERSDYTLDAVCFNSCGNCQLIDNTVSFTDTPVSFLLAPNPTHQYVQILLSVPSETYTVSIMDLQGREIWTRRSSTARIDLPVSNMERGLYWVKVQTSDGAISTQKLVLQ
ncbi:MAG: FG-GAP-like repeat-containing protein [Bacteroidota bacterium]